MKKANSIINLKNGKIEDYTIVLSTRDYRKIGQIKGIKSNTVRVNNRLNSFNETSFSICKFDMFEHRSFLSDEEYKKYLSNQELIWSQIVDFKLIWVKELDEYYQIKVSVEDTSETIKTITATSLCEAELSQIRIDSLEVNSEIDVERSDYDVTTFCNFENTSLSLLHRTLKEKAPHYKILHVDESLKDEVRAFSVSGTYIYDFFTNDVAQELNCVFVFDSTQRGISVYDLLTVCVDCGHRGDFHNTCPECGSRNLKYFGKDTTILVDKNNLTDSIRLDTNADSVKNCLKLVAGDDLMTDTIRLLNPNGSDYLYYISEFQMKDMPDLLVKKLKDYQNLYDSYVDEYQKLIGQYYEATDRLLYLESSMMPTPETFEVTSKTEADKLTTANLSPLGLSSITKSTSSSTVNSALKNYAKIYIKTGYVKLDVDGEFKYLGTDSDNCNYGTWTGTFTVTNYSNKDDVVTTSPVTIKVYDNYEDFIRQKVQKSLVSESDDSSVLDVLGISVPGNFEKELKLFKDAISLYSRNRLKSFYDSIQSAMDILVQMKQADESAELYNTLYYPYLRKLQACQEALDRIEGYKNEENCSMYYEKDGIVYNQCISDIEANLENVNNELLKINSKLDFRNYLGDELYNIYCAYRREDVYENKNYISDGLSNTELIERAKKFIEVANKELKRAAEPQFTITSTLKNFLTLSEFSPIVDKFDLGNWIRMRVDGNLYRLRLIEYSIGFNNINNIEVTFSTITQVKDVLYEAQQMHKTTQSMATSFTYVSRQAKQGAELADTVNKMQSGLNAAKTRISNNTTEDVIFDKNGLLCRSTNDETGTYDPEQFRITHNIMAYTSDNWKTVKQAIGKNSYMAYDPETNQWYLVEGYGVDADYVSADSQIYGAIMVGGKIYSKDYSDGTNGREAQGTFIDLEEGILNVGAGGLTYSPEDGLKIKSASLDGKITSTQIDVGSINTSDLNNDGSFASVAYVTASIQESIDKTWNASY